MEHLALLIRCFGETEPQAWRDQRTVLAVIVMPVVAAGYVANRPVVQLALGTPTVCGSRSITRSRSAFHAGVTVGAMAGALPGGMAAIPLCRKRLSTCS